MTFHPVGQTIGNLVPPLTIANGGTGQTTQAAALTALLGSSAVPVANGGTGATTVDAATVSLGFPFPTLDEMGYLAWNYPAIWAQSNSATLTSGVVYVHKVPLPGTTISVTNIVAGVFAAGNTLTLNQCVAAVYDSTGTQIGVTGDQHTNWTSTGLKIMALTGGPFNTSSTFAYVAIVTNGTTNPQFCRAFGPGAGSGFITQGQSGSGLWFASNGTGATAAPASLTYSSNSNANNPQSTWVALS